MRGRLLCSFSIVAMLSASGCVADSSPTDTEEEGQRSDELTASSGLAIWTKIYRPASTNEQYTTPAVATDGTGDTFVVRLRVNASTGSPYSDLSRYSSTGALEMRKGLTDGRAVTALAVGGGLAATIQTGERGSPAHVVVYEAATGVERWRKEQFTNWTLHPRFVAVDAAGRVVVLGMMEGSGAAIDGAVVDDQNQTDNQGAVIAQFTSTGTLAWARRYGSSSPNPEMYVNGHDVAVDGDGDVYVSGSFSKDINFGGGTVLTNAEPWGTDGRNDGHLIDDGWVLKLSAAGTKRWVTHLQGAAEQRPLKIAVTSGGRVALAGNFRKEVKYDGGAVYAANPQNDLETKAFFTKLDTAGQHTWSKTWDGTSGSAITVARVMLNVGGGVVLAGWLRGTLTQGTTTYSTGGTTDAFAGTFSATTGARQWLRTYGEQGSNVRATAAALTSSGRLMLGGDLVGSVDFGRGVITHNNGSAGSTAGFLGRFYE